MKTLLEMIFDTARVVKEIKESNDKSQLMKYLLLESYLINLRSKRTYRNARKLSESECLNTVITMDELDITIEEIQSTDKVYYDKIPYLSNQKALIYLNELKGLYLKDDTSRLPDVRDIT